MRTVGYARGDDLDHQRKILALAECDAVYIDTTGPRDERPELDRAVSELQRHDTLVIVRLSAITVTVRQLLKLARTLSDRGVWLVVTGDDPDRLVLGDAGQLEVLVAVDDCLRDLIAEGTRTGMAAARARGRHGGRKAKLTPDRAAAAQADYDRQEDTVEAIADRYGVSKSTLYRHIDIRTERRQEASAAT
jgi:DNA invertase Pin-like site-specific DNA recombinase